MAPPFGFHFPEWFAPRSTRNAAKRRTWDGPTLRVVSAVLLIRCR
jgi:hypothetical protein